jgi:hypothetical protein
MPHFMWAFNAPTASAEFFPGTHTRPSFANRFMLVDMIGAAFVE